MKNIEVNNKYTTVLESTENGLEVISLRPDKTIEYSYNIPDGELIMVLNYYRSCKAGYEKSDFISKGKIKNTNVEGEEYL